MVDTVSTSYIYTTLVCYIYNLYLTKYPFFSESFEGYKKGDIKQQKKDFYKEILAQKPPSLEIFKNESDDQKFLESKYSWDIEIIESVDQMQKHCLNSSSRAKHYHDLVKLLDLPNLFSSEFKEKN